jgi:ribosomal protein L29
MKIKVLSIKELRAAKPADITKYIQDMQKQRIALLEQINTGKSKQTHLLGKMRRSVAAAKLAQAEASEKKEENK